MTPIFLTRLILAFICTLILAIYLILSRNKLPKTIKISTKKIILISIVFFILITAILMLFKLENIFYSFNSPEEAFEYQHQEKIVEIFDYNEYTLVVATDENHSATYRYILPKNENRWKLDGFLKTRSASVSTGYCIIYYTYIPKYDDCFIYIFGETDKLSGVTTQNIYDNINSDFKRVECNNESDFVFCLVEDIDNNYQLFVDDTEIELNIN